MTSPEAATPTLTDRVVLGIRNFFTPGPRMIDEIECLVSIGLAIVLAHWLEARTVSWAAFTALVLMRGHVSETLARGIMRMIGTALGAGLALLAIPLAASSLPAQVVAAAIFGTAAMYGTLTAKRSYAWLLFGLTYEMILLDKLEHPSVDAAVLAQTRLIEVAAGTVACCFVSLLSTITARRFWPGPEAPAAVRIGWHPNAARHAVQTGVALGLLPIVHHFLTIPELWQASVTIMAVMIVPAASIGTSGLAPVSQRLFLRLAGCAAGALMSAAVLLIAEGSVPVLIAGMCLGVLIGRHIENGQTRLTYLGLQFTLAILVALVPDSYADIGIGPALARLYSIFVGLGIIAPVLLVCHAVMRPEETEIPADAGTGGE